MTPDPVADPPPGSTSASASEPYRELIERELAKGRNAKGIWQDLVDDHGFTGGYQSVKRFVRKIHGPAAPQPCAVIVTKPGEEAQVDYGEGPLVLDPENRALSPHPSVRVDARL